MHRLTIYTSIQKMPILELKSTQGCHRYLDLADLIGLDNTGSESRIYGGDRPTAQTTTPWPDATGNPHFKVQWPRRRLLERHPAKDARVAEGVVHSVPRPATRAGSSSSSRGAEPARAALTLRPLGIVDVLLSYVDVRRLLMEGRVSVRACVCGGGGRRSPPDSQPSAAGVRAHLHIDDDGHVPRALEVPSGLPDEERADAGRLGGHAVAVGVPSHRGAIGDPRGSAQFEDVVRHGAAHRGGSGSSEV